MALGDGVYRDLCLHWDAQRLLFAWGNGSDSWDGKLSYHIYEVGADGGGLRQITRGPKNDCEPFYLPNGQIGFTSDRSEHFVMCGGDRHSPNLFVTDAAGAEVRRLSFNVFNDYNPAVLPDGRIIYGRWEYNERSVTSLHNPFTMHPDGRMVSPYYGNATIRPNVVMFPRPVPGSNLVMALFTAHHGQTHGAVGLIDVRRGIDGPEPLTVLTPGVPITGEKARGQPARLVQRSAAAGRTDVALLVHAHRAALAGDQLGPVRRRPAWQSGAGVPRSRDLVRRAGAAGRSAPAARAAAGAGSDRFPRRRSDADAGRCLPGTAGRPAGHGQVLANPRGRAAREASTAAAWCARRGR